MNNPHHGARLTVHSRVQIVARILAGQRAVDVAAAFAVSVRTLRKWLARYRAGGAVRSRHASGTVAQAHPANGLAAIYVATGQDAACVAESAVGFTRMERREAGLFCSVTMPSILVGTVGDGTGLPTQSACLELMGLKGEGHGPALAEVTAAACHCGEISIVAAMASGAFSGAHEKLARLR